MRVSKLMTATALAVVLGLGWSGAATAAGQSQQTGQQAGMQQDQSRADLREARMDLERIAQQLQATTGEPPEAMRQEAEQALDKLEQSLQQMRTEAADDRQQDYDQLQQDIADARTQLQQDPQQAAGMLQEISRQSEQLAQADTGQQQMTGAAATGAAGTGAATTGAATTGTATTGTATTGAAEAAGTTAWYSQLRADELVGETVQNQRGDTVGEIEHVVVDSQTGKPHAVISVGGFLGIGDKDIAIPLDQLRMGEEDVILMSDADSEQLKDNPEYEEGRYREIEGDRTLGEAAGMQ